MPIHTFFTEAHLILLQDKKICPNAMKIYKKNQKRKEVVNFLKEMKKNMKKISDISNEAEGALMNYIKAYYIFDTFIAQCTEGLPIFEENLRKKEWY